MFFQNYIEYCHPQNYERTLLEEKIKNHSKKMLNKLGPKIEPWGKPDIIPDFGTAILNPIDIFSRQYKLKFGPCKTSLNHAISQKRYTRGDNIFAKKQLGQPVCTMIWIYYYLLNEIKLELDLDNTCLIWKIPSFATNNLNIWFFTDQTLSALGKPNLLNLIVLLTA